MLELVFEIAVLIVAVDQAQPPPVDERPKPTKLGCVEVERAVFATRNKLCVNPDNSVTLCRETMVEHVIRCPGRPERTVVDIPVMRGREAKSVADVTRDLKNSENQPKKPSATYTYAR